MKLLAALFSSLLLSTPVLAAGASSMDIATTLGSLLFVLALILVLAWVLKRMQHPAIGSQKDLKILRQIPVGTKERIAVVQAGEEQYLVGITPNSINLISRLDKTLDTEVPESTPFANQLSQILKKDAKK
ncbi:flagellar biosynthetic protein FliO [Vibrio sp. HN007]|uniref:flagellar biosynthetic protein FliO n=1 Tax=Vibrio iocasae TaxID=3098914 RepID=UPI0035D4EC5E